MTKRPATLFATPEIIRNGVCQCCGEVHPLPLDQIFHAQCDADTWATAHCDCLEGENDRQSTAMLVYMGTIGKVSIPVTEGEAAKIFVKKGTLTIARKAVKEQSLEVLV